MDAKNQFLEKYPEFREHQDEFSCRTSKRKGFLIKFLFHEREISEEAALDAMREMYSGVPTDGGYEEKLQSYVSDRSIIEPHPDRDNIRKVDLRLVRLVTSKRNKIRAHVMLTIYPVANSKFLPVTRHADMFVNAETRNKLENLLRNVRFEDYNPEKFAEYQSGFEACMENWKREILQVESDPLSCDFLNPKEKFLLNDFFSRDLRLTNADQICKNKNGYKILSGRICITVSETGEMSWKRKDEILSVLKDWKAFQKYKMFCETIKEEKVIRDYKPHRGQNGITITMFYNYNGFRSAIELNVEDFPEDKDSLLERIKENEELEFTDTKEAVIRSGCLDDPVSNCIVEIVKANDGFFSKTTIFNILNGRKVNVGVRGYKEKMQLLNKKVSLSEVEEKLRELVCLDILDTETCYGKYQTEYDVYSLSDADEAIWLFGNKEPRTDHQFEEYRAYDWKNLIENDDPAGFSLDDWMRLQSMWNSDVLYIVSIKSFYGFWKKAPDQVLDYMKNTIRDQPLAVKKIWKQILASKKEGSK